MRLRRRPTYGLRSHPAGSYRNSRVASHHPMSGPMQTWTLCLPKGGLGGKVLSSHIGFPTWSPYRLGAPVRLSSLWVSLPNITLQTTLLICYFQVSLLPTPYSSLWSQLFAMPYPRYSMAQLVPTCTSRFRLLLEPALAIGSATSLS